MFFSMLGKHNGIVHTSIFILCTILFLFLSIFYFDFIEWLAIFSFSTVLTGFTMSGYLHRYCSHRSWKMPRWLEVTLMMCTTVLMNSPAMAWAAIHLAHHKYTDTENDPHGWSKSILQNFNVFTNVPPRRHIPRWMLRDKLYGFQAKWYWELAIFLQIIVCYLLGWEILVSLISLSYLYQVGLNLVGHTPELKPRNNAFLSIFWMGELYHANHHWTPNNPRFGMIDGTYYFMIKWAQKLVKN